MNSRYIIIASSLSSYNEVLSALKRTGETSVVILDEKTPEEKFDLSSLVDSIKFEVTPLPFVEADVPFYRRFYKTKKDSKFKK
jgi:hypothetical protein